MPITKYEVFQPKERCCFCQLRRTDVLFGPIYKSRTKYQNNYIVLHYYCLLMASEIKQNGRDDQGILGFFPKDIIIELKRVAKKNCSFCHKPGASVHCIHKDCDKSFHLPCGVDRGSIHQFYEYFNSYCHNHRPKQTIPPTVFKQVKDSCLICSLEIDKQNKYHSLWPICCKPSVLLHRRCIQTMACNAGYYFKCPLCNNTEKFRKEMNRLGIYVPQQDASWELEPNAYHDLGVRGSGCESSICVCPKGRDFSRESTPWQIELCKVCGGNGIHLGCTPTWKKNVGYNYNWFCDICKPVYLENKVSHTPERSSEEASANGLEDSNGSTRMSSQSSEMPENIPQQIPAQRDNCTRTVSSAPVEETRKASLDPEKDILIILSEDDEPPQSAENNDSSGEDIEVVGVAAGKRRKIDMAPRKRLRNETSEQVSVLNKRHAGPSSVNYTPNVVHTSMANQTLAVKRPAAQLESHLHSVSRSSLGFSVLSGKADSPVKLLTEGNNIASNIGLNLNEISINKVVKKACLFKMENQIIDLSCDDESDLNNDADSKSRLNAPQEEATRLNSSLKLRSLLASSPLPRADRADRVPKHETPISSINRRIEAWMDGGVSALQSFRKSNEVRSNTSNSLPILKNLSSNSSLAALVTVVLSSDEEDADGQVSNKPTCSKASRDLNSSSGSFKNTSTTSTFKGIKSPEERIPAAKLKTESLDIILNASNQVSFKLNSPSTSNLSDSTAMLTPKNGYKLVLPNSPNNFSTNKTVSVKESDVLILIDDDDEEEVVQSVSSDKISKQINPIPRNPDENTTTKIPPFNEGICVISNVTSLFDPAATLSGESCFYNGNKERAATIVGGFQELNESCKLKNGIDLSKESSPLSLAGSFEDLSGKSSQVLLTDQSDSCKNNSLNEESLQINLSPLKSSLQICKSTVITECNDEVVSSTDTCSDIKKNDDETSVWPTPNCEEPVSSTTIDNSISITESHKNADATLANSQVEV